MIQRLSDLRKERARRRLPIINSNVGNRWWRVELHGGNELIKMGQFLCIPWRLAYLEPVT